MCVYYSPSSKSDAEPRQYSITSWKRQKGHRSETSGHPKTHTRLRVASLNKWPTTPNIYYIMTQTKTRKASFITIIAEVVETKKLEKVQSSAKRFS
jgi:hypothetical protein